ncbi:MAG: energy transducer TonB [Bacteroidota bacterium]|nr:energy transducer TonB [Bacteroidota bacterium]
MNAKTEHPGDRMIAGTISLIIGILLFLFLFFYTITTRNPPFDLIGDEGMEMNFGTYNEGTGEVENNGIGDATNVVTEESVSTPPPTENTAAEIFENGEPIVKADPKTPTPKSDNATTIITPVKPTNTNNSLLSNFVKGNVKPGTNGGGDGSSGTAGNDGVPDGNPNTNGLGGNGNNPNQIGNSAGGSGFSLAGRKAISLPKVNDSKEEGIVVVTIKVNKEGKVIDAEPNGRGTNTSSSALKSKARQAALSAVFSPSPNGSDEQIGTITFKFEF